MSDKRDREDMLGEEERRDEARGRGALDPGLKEQFERDRIVVRDHPSETPESDALQRPHYGPTPASDAAPPAS